MKTDDMTPVFSVAFIATQRMHLLTRELLFQSVLYALIFGKMGWDASWNIWSFPVSWFYSFTVGRMSKRTDEENFKAFSVHGLRSPVQVNEMTSDLNCNDEKTFTVHVLSRLGSNACLTMGIRKNDKWNQERPFCQ